MRSLGSAFVLAACLTGAAGAGAAVIVVEADFILVGGNSPLCELDEAIQSANDDFPIGGCDEGNGADVIRFDVAGGTIEVPQELPAIEETLTIEGPGAGQLTLDAQLGSRILTVDAGVAFTLQGLTLAGGAPTAGNGGALLALPGSNVTLRDCRITGSEAPNGGGIYVDQATLRVERCLIDANTAAAQGGGLLSSGSAAELVNTTVSGNSAVAGGGLAAVDAGATPGTTSLHSVTFADNGAEESVFVAGGSQVAARHTLFSGPNCNAPITSLDFNLADDPSCGLDGPGDVQGAPTGIAALAANGGPTASHALQPTSAAIDGGDTSCRDAQDVVLATDQRGPGFPRLTNGDGLPGTYCDIGAYEAPEPGAGAAAAAVAAVLAALARRRSDRLPSAARPAS